MKNILRLSFSVVMLILVGMVSVAPCGYLNPYGPYNSVAAEPMEPYNIDQIPQMSTVFYLPCPSSVPYANQFPDKPPFWQPMTGPFGIPVPQP